MKEKQKSAKYTHGLFGFKNNMLESPPKKDR